MQHRYVFVGGLHRSGTSLLARLIAAHPQVASINDAPVPENEGCYLQGAIPHTALHGRPMHFATDPDQHLIEGHPLDTLATRQRLEADWAPWFDPSRPWRVEKSPVNLTRTRLYQQLFPLSQSILILRHPEAVAAAVGKWVDAPAGVLIDHWIAAHHRLAQDIRHLHAVMILRYEDLVADPAGVMARVFGFLSLPAITAPEALRNGNDDYLHEAPMTLRQSREVERWGYDHGLSVRPHVS
ncbi:sulfotransferase family protein, partial [Paracoccus sp. (in: a-proteobacteria)]|uniref:sulfotransferase family protein n=1 Tax=Paracoccus sp. TaxID=267 RepID=UPI00396CDCDF